MVVWWGRLKYDNGMVIRPCGPLFGRFESPYERLIWRLGLYARPKKKNLIRISPGPLRSVAFGLTLGALWLMRFLVE